MALTATVHQFHVDLSDVDRAVYATFDLRVARHPSESMRFMLTRVLAYALSYEEGIAFSKGGLSAAEEAPVAIHDPTGILLAWIDVGNPSAERLHKASKAARRVAIFTHFDLALLRKEAARKVIHRASEIEVFRLDPAFLDALETKVDRTSKMDLVRNEGQLYVTMGGASFETAVTRATLEEAEG